MPEDFYRLQENGVLAAGGVGGTEIGLGFRPIDQLLLEDFEDQDESDTHGRFDGDETVFETTSNNAISGSFSWRINVGNDVPATGKLLSLDDFGSRPIAVEEEILVVSQVDASNHEIGVDENFDLTEQSIKNGYNVVIGLRENDLRVTRWDGATPTVITSITTVSPTHAVGTARTLRLEMKTDDFQGVVLDQPATTEQTVVSGTDVTHQGPFHVHERAIEMDGRWDNVRVATRSTFTSF